MSSAFKLLADTKYVESETPFEEGKPYKGFGTLPHGNHEVISFRFVRNKYYDPKKENPGLKRSLLVELSDQVLFLPEYFAQKFNDDDKQIEELNNDGVKKYLYFGGSRPNR